MRRPLAVFTLVALTACGTLLSIDSDPVAMTGGDGGDAAAGDGGGNGGDAKVSPDGTTTGDAGGDASCGFIASDPLNCGACGRRCNADAGCSAGQCGGLVVFVTSTGYKGNAFGGLNGDGECEALATAAGLGGHFRVWLSVANVDRFNPPVSGPYFNTRGERLSASWPPGDVLENAIRYDELGRTTTVGQYAWSNLPGSGVPTAGNDCAGWANVSVAGALGNSLVTGSTWSRDVLSEPCGNVHHLYCVERRP